MMFKTYPGHLPIHPRWYELPFVTFRSSVLSVAQIHGEKHDARDTIRLYKDTMREDAMEFCNPLVRTPTKQV